MWWTELRGIIAVGLVAAAIVIAWNVIENRDYDTETTVPAATSTSTTTTEATTTTLSQDDANALICLRAQQYANEAAALGPDPGPGPVAQLALPFWRDVAELATGSGATEIVPVVAFYEDYLATAGPFDFDPARVIVEGDKEKFEFLMTRPTNGLDEWRSLIGFACQIEVPDKPSMTQRAYDDLEERLLDDD